MAFTKSLSVSVLHKTSNYPLCLLTYFSIPRKSASGVWSSFRSKHGRSWGGDTHEQLWARSVLGCLLIKDFWYLWVGDWCQRLIDLLQALHSVTSTLLHTCPPTVQITLHWKHTLFFFGTRTRRPWCNLAALAKWPSTTTWLCCPQFPSRLSKTKTL